MLRTNMGFLSALRGERRADDRGSDTSPVSSRAYFTSSAVRKER